MSHATAQLSDEAWSLLEEVAASLTCPMVPPTEARFELARAGFLWIAYEGTDRWTVTRAGLDALAARNQTKENTNA